MIPAGKNGTTGEFGACQTMSQTTIITQCTSQGPRLELRPTRTLHKRLWALPSFFSVSDLSSFGEGRGGEGGSPRTSQGSRSGTPGNEGTVSRHRTRSRESRRRSVVVVVSSATGLLTWGFLGMPKGRGTRSAAGVTCPFRARAMRNSSSSGGWSRIKSPTFLSGVLKTAFFSLSRHPPYRPL